MALDKLVTRETLKTVVGEVVTEQEQIYAKQDGFYETFGYAKESGVSANLKNRDNSFVGAEYTYRTSGGSADIGTGTAEIKKLKGNSVIENGEIINFNGNGIKTIGFNQWDEEWEVGTINQTSGQNENASDRIRSKNYIRVIPSTQYYLQTSSNEARFYVSHYGVDKSHISTASTDTGRIFTTPSNCYYIRFRTLSSYGTTYKNDICINLSWSGIRNGEYEAYNENTLSFDISSIKDELGETLFADGLCKVGNVYDEITKVKAIKRIGVRPYASGDSENTSVLTDGTTTLYVLDTPIEVDIDWSNKLTYKVDDFGTEEMLTLVASAPIDYDVLYAMNAVDTLRRLPETYIRKESFDNFCSSLVTAMASIGYTMSITPTYNGETNEYDYSITLEEQGEEEL